MADKRDIALMREQLRKITNKEIYKDVIEILNENFSKEIQSIFIIHEIPEQFEDVYVSIVNGECVATIDVNRSDKSYKITKESLSDYKKSHPRSKLINRKISAIEYINKEISSK